MATYKHRFTPATGNDPDISLFHVVELPLYGSSRLGVDAQEVDLATATPTAPSTAHPSQWRYELTDHLGNVQAVVTEELLGLDGNNDQSVDQWAPVLLSAQDYEPFGALLPGRNYGSGSYNYGFQGQEKDDEMHGATGTSYAFTYRMHDARVGRFLSIDPLVQQYPWNSPYAFSENRVTDGTEVEGLEWRPGPNRRGIDCDALNHGQRPQLDPKPRTGKPVIEVVRTENVRPAIHRELRVFPNVTNESVQTKVDATRRPATIVLDADRVVDRLIVKDLRKGPGNGSDLLIGENLIHSETKQGGKYEVTVIPGSEFIVPPDGEEVLTVYTLSIERHYQKTTNRTQAKLFGIIPVPDSRNKKETNIRALDRDDPGKEPGKRRLEKKSRSKDGDD